MVKRVDTAVFETIRAVQQHAFVGGVRTFGVADDGVKWVYDARNQALIPDAVKARVDALQADIVSGKIVAPTLP